MASLHAHMPHDHMPDNQMPDNQMRNNDRPQNHRPGQATTEYALVLLVAAVIALLVIAWATTGDGGGKIGGLFDSMFDMILQRAESPQ